MKNKVFIAFAFVLVISSTAFATNVVEFVAEKVDFMIFVNGDEKQFENPIVIIDNRTYLPVREVAEALNMGVYWDGSDGKVMISDYDSRSAFDELTTVTYPEIEIKYGARNNFSKDCAAFPKSVIRFCESYIYIVVKSEEDNYYFYLYEKETGEWVSRAIFNSRITYTLALLNDKIKIGETTVEDIEQITPAFYDMPFSQIDGPIVRRVWTNDGYEVIIRFSTDTRVAEEVFIESDVDYPIVFNHLIQIDKDKITNWGMNE